MLTEKKDTVVIRPCGVDDESFIRSCQDEDEFRETIGDLPLEYKSCSILKCSDSRVGCAVITPLDMFGVRYVAVSVFILRRYRLLSAIAIRLVLNKAAETNPKPEKIMFLVYDDNLPCIALMHHFGIECAAEVPRVCYRNDRYVGVRYYFFPLDGKRYFSESLECQ